MTFEDGLLFALLPALLGAGVAAAVILSAARRAPSSPEQKGRAFVFIAIPMNAALLALVATMQVATSAADARTPLLALGAGALVASLGQGMFGARALAAVARDPSQFGRALVPLAAMEALVVVPFVWVLMVVGAPASV